MPTKTAAGILTPCFPFSCLFNHFFSFLFCMKECECEKFQAFMLFKKPQTLEPCRLFLKMTMKKWQAGCILCEVIIFSTI